MRQSSTYILGSIVSLLFLGFGGLQLIGNGVLFLTGTYAEGTAVRSIASPNSKGIPTYTSIVTFEAIDGETYTISARPKKRAPRYSKEDVVPIRYHAQNPEGAVLWNIGDALMTPLITSAVGLLGILLFRTAGSAGTWFQQSMGLLFREMRSSRGPDAKGVDKKAKKG